MPLMRVWVFVVWIVVKAADSPRSIYRQRVREPLLLKLNDVGGGAVYETGRGVGAGRAGGGRGSGAPRPLPNHSVHIGCARAADRNRVHIRRGSRSLNSMTTQRRPADRDCP